MQKTSISFGDRRSVKLLVCLCLLFSLTAGLFSGYASEPYEGYNYNENQERVASPNGYLPIEEINGNSLGVTKLVSPTDIFVDANDYIYILDAGNDKNGRVLKVDKDFNLVAEIAYFTTAQAVGLQEDAVQTEAASTPAQEATVSEEPIETAPSDMPEDAAEDTLESASEEPVAVDTDFRQSVVQVATSSSTPRQILKKPSGIYVTKDGQLYICDTDNNRVLRVQVCYDTTQGAYIGVILQQYKKPVTEMISKEGNFAPEKVVVTATGDMYILSKNVTDGAVIITEDDEFCGFFGAEKVEMTLEKMMDYMWSKILSKKQAAKYAQNKEVRYSNMYLDGDFVYTVSKQTSLTAGQIKKVNPANANVIDSSNFRFGDATVNIDPQTGKVLSTSFVDVAADKDNFIYCLDAESGKVYMYDQQLDLLMIFGGRGYETGTFRLPTAMETIDGKILVLDREKCSVTVFEPTTFGDTVREAVLLYDHGKYEEALVPWEEVKKMNSNYEIAYKGIGRAYLMMGKSAEQQEGETQKEYATRVKDYYRLAMKNFKLAYSRQGYSDAKAELRSDLIRENFSLMLTVLVAIIVLWVLIKKNRDKIRKKLGLKSVEEKGYANMSKWKYPFYTMFHPIDGYQEMRYNKKGSLGIGILFVVLWYLSEVLIRQFEDFTFNPTNPDKLNIFLIFFGTIGIFMIAIASNWALCTLFDGKGKFKDIFIGASYAMLPTILATFIVTIISKFMISGEAVFIQVLLTVAYLWSALLIIVGTQTIHEFDGVKGILMLFLTAVVMVLVLFLLMLLYVLFLQVFSFVITLYYEIIYRVGV